jgi:ribokinase
MPSQKPILVVGSINMDLVATADHIPAPGETILGTGFETHPGGKGANQAVAVARLGYPVRMIGQLGSDSIGEELRSRLNEAGVDTGVDTGAVGTVPGASGVALITVSARGDNSIVVASGANNQVTPAYLDQHAGLIQEAGIVLAQLEIPLESVVHLAQLCAAANVPLILDPAPARELPPELFPLVAWITPNETEAAFYLQGKALQTAEAAQELLAKGGSGVILKLGAQGAWLAEKSGAAQTIAPFPVKAIDSTAAGDAFNGAFATGLMLGKTPVEAARFASAASAISVTRKGAQSSMPTFQETQELLGPK